MKKQLIFNLITSHYENDPELFFETTIDILKEFKANGDDEIVKHLDYILKSKVKIRPKREEPKWDPEISFEDASYLDWIPMENK